MCTDDETSPLLIVCSYGHFDIAYKLLAMNVDVNKSDVNGVSPLTMACQMNNYRTTDRLIDHNANIETKMYDGDNPLLSAAREDCDNIVELLLKKGVKCNGSLHAENYLISYLCYHPTYTLEDYEKIWYKDIISKVSEPVKKYLQSKPIEYVFSLCAGSSSLHFACFMGLERLVKLLIEYQADVNLSKDDGTTPLFYACEFGHISIVRLLLENNDTPKIGGRGRKYPLDIATRNGHFEFVSLIMGKENMFNDNLIPNIKVECKELGV